MKEFWRRKHLEEKRQESFRKFVRHTADVAVSPRLSGPVKYVTDDSVTAMTEILRKLMDTGDLALFLANKAHAIVREANGTGKEE